jgi:RNA polymerase sigma factor (TIGR02999 family)
LPPDSDVTRILSTIDAGDLGAAQQLFPLVYDELRRLAAAQLAHERPGLSLDTTALVHEAWIRLAGGQTFAGRTHFLRASAEAMRRILVDRARARNAGKRGGRWSRAELAEWHKVAQSPEQVLALNEALDRFAVTQPRKAELVTLRFFGGMTMPQVADALGVSVPTAERWWAFARAWLYTELSNSD